MKPKAQEILDTLENVLRVFDKGALRFEVQKIDGQIGCKVEYKNMAYRGVIGYAEDAGGVYWRFNPSFYPDPADEDDFLDLVFKTLEEVG